MCRPQLAANRPYVRLGEITFRYEEVDDDFMRNTVNILAYTSALAVAPGDSLRIMVSTPQHQYAARLVRLIHGDPSTDGPGFLEDEVPSDLDGVYPGREQSVRAGSWAFASTKGALSALRDVTVHAWICPTTPLRGRRQGILSCSTSTATEGFLLDIDSEGRLGFTLGTGKRPVRVTEAEPLQKQQWYQIAATYRSSDQSAMLFSRQMDQGRTSAHEPVLTRRVGIDAHLRTDAQVSIAAVGCAPEAERDPFNGKIDCPVVVGRAATPSELMAVSSFDDLLAWAASDLLIAWDFSLKPSSNVATDVGPHQLDATLVNMPTRAVTGHSFTGREVDFRNAPTEYGAIHFHEDDLEDADWQADVEFIVPPDLPSGIYAARLTTEVSERHVPIFVTRSADKADATDVIFLVPTFTYRAYGNSRTVGRSSEEERRRVTGRAGRIDPGDLYLVTHPELGGSLYDTHHDGSGCCYSSVRRPLLNLSPTHHNSSSDGARHLRTDLCIGYWLSHTGVAWEVTTDEVLHAQGLEAISGCKVVVTGSHPEYYSYEMLQSLRAFLDSGGRLMYLGGNGFYWVTSVDSNRPHVIEVRRGNSGTRTWDSPPGELHHSTTGEPGGLWRHRGLAPQRVCGLGFTGMGWREAAGYRRSTESYTDDYTFLFEGINGETFGDFGLALGGAAGDELDRADVGLGTPRNVRVLASSRHPSGYVRAIEELTSLLPGDNHDGDNDPDVRSDVVIFDTEGGGAVFSVGSITWAGALTYHNCDNDVARLTENVLRYFLRV